MIQVTAASNRPRRQQLTLRPGQFPLAAEFEAPDIKYAPLMGNRPEYGPRGPPTFGPRVPPQVTPTPVPNVVIEGGAPVGFGHFSMKKDFS